MYDVVVSMWTGSTSQLSALMATDIGTTLTFFLSIVMLGIVIGIIFGILSKAYKR